MATDSVAKAQATGGVYPARKRGETPPGNEATGAAASQAIEAGPTGRVNNSWGPTDAGWNGKGGRINALA